MSKFSERLRLLRGATTQRETADALGVNPASYANWENRREPPYDMLVKIAEYYDVTVDYLIGRTDYTEPAYEQTSIDTGLSEEAIKGLKILADISTEEDNQFDILNFLLEPKYLPSGKISIGLSLFLKLFTKDSDINCSDYINKDCTPEQFLEACTLLETGMIHEQIKLLEKAIRTLKAELALKEYKKQKDRLHI